MNRLASSFQPAPPASAATREAPTLLARTLREPSLVRLAQSIADLSPDLARALCSSGLASMPDPVEREVWRVRLAPFLEGESVSDSGERGESGDGGPALAAA